MEGLKAKLTACSASLVSNCKPFLVPPLESTSYLRTAITTKQEIKPALPIVPWFSKYRHTSFFLTLCFIAVWRYYAFYKLKTCSNPELSKSIGAIFSNSICSLHVSVSHLGNLHNISSFIIFIFVMVICDLWCYYHNYFGAPRTIPIKDSKP